jgi:ABC-type sugar transport system substrate-binding protein
MKRFLTMILALALVFGLAACASTTPPAGNTPAVNATPAPPPAGEEAPPPADGDLPGAGLKVGFAQIHYTNGFRIAETQSVIDAFEEVGFEVVWNEAKKDTATQISNVNDLLAQDIDYLVLAPNEMEGLVASLDAAKAQGVPVVLIDRIANGTPGVDYITGIVSNFIWAGEACANWIAEKYPDGANVAIISGTPGAAASIERIQGFKDALPENCTIVAEQTANYNRSEAQTVMENFLQAHGDGIDVVFTENDDMQFGIMMAIEGAGLVPGQDVDILGSGDGGVEVVRAIAEGKISACAECTPLLGPQARDVILGFMNGETFPDRIQSNDRFFTIDNAQEIIDSGYTW